jgi:ferric-dicitrate binding protein FerR (iron transport regulator)
MNDEFDLLVEAYLAGSAGPAEARRLEELLRSDPALGQAFVLALDEDVALRKHFSFDPEAAPVPVQSAPPRPAARRSSLRPSARSASPLWAPLLAGATLFMALLMWVAVSEPKPQVQVRRPERTREERERARQRLTEIERERQALVEAPAAPGAKPDVPRGQEQTRRLTQLEAERRRIQEDLQESAAAAPKAEPAPTPAPPPPRSLPSPPPSGTVAAEPTRAEASPIGVDHVDGQAFVLAPSGKTPAVAGARVGPGEEFETVGTRSGALLSFADGTRLDVAGDSLIREVADPAAARGKRLTLARGSLTARVVHQTAGPMIVVTPHGDARVLGTTFRVIVETASTRLEVVEGKVQLRRRDGKSVEVSAGHGAVAGSGIELVSRPLPIEEIVLVPDQARVSGNEWKMVKDPAAATGVAMEAADTAYKLKKSGSDSLIYESVRNRTAYVFFTFLADAGRDYHVWIRGRSMATTDRKFHDEVAIEPLGGQLSQKCRQLGWTGDNAYCYTGWCLYPAYGWLGGYGEDGTSDAVPLSIRFSRPGLQTLKLYAIETPMRIDAIWLSTTQGARPSPDQRPPLREGK